MSSLQNLIRRMPTGKACQHAERASSLSLRRGPNYIACSASSRFGYHDCISKGPFVLSRPHVGASESYSTTCSRNIVSRSFSAEIDTTIICTNDGTMHLHDTGSAEKLSSPPMQNVIETNAPINEHKPSTPSQEETSLLPPLSEEEYDPRYVVSHIKRAHLWNQGKLPNEPNSKHRNRKHSERKWDYEYVRSTLDLYERHLQYILSHLQSSRTAENTEQFTDPTILFANIHPNSEKCKDTNILVAPSTLAAAVRALTRSRLDTPILSRRIRNIERFIGSIGWTPITEDLSYRLLEANGKAGNVRRTLALLELRRRRDYEPKEKEFIHVINSIQSAQLSIRRSRNIYLHETALPESALDNPTRYLDAILVNMSQRGVRLTPDLAAFMLSCYSSTGRTGRAVHYFYKVVSDPVEEDGVYIPGPHPTHLGKEELEDWKNKKRGEGMGRLLVSRDASSDLTEAKGSAYEELEAMKADDDDAIKKRARMILNSPPPFHKIPSAVRGASLSQSQNQEETQQTKATTSNTKSRTKLERELERDWSLSLTAAFAFADSLTHGACGHDPIELNISAWNTLIKACCYRGAFHRALKILNETLPQKGVDPNSISYNTILAGLARVGDIASLRELLVKMTNKNIPVTKYTAQAMADGLLNMGDISGASTIVQVRYSSNNDNITCFYLSSNKTPFCVTQDIFNQHDTLPP
ncbi:hypothetical protein ACHAWO_006847 [Cyclotella atomus]|uniref:Pentatricopeptide repeat-containing protein n=1 Tax=Cyclotella atomus TaxID=382360 RepID=A0ABD3NVE4_9STRA